jgi:spermidine/putrescine transport system permease protein
VSSSIRRAVTSEINAIGTVVLLSSFALLAAAQVILRWGSKAT